MFSDIPDSIISTEIIDAVLTDVINEPKKTRARTQRGVLARQKTELLTRANRLGLLKPTAIPTPESKQSLRMRPHEFIHQTIGEFSAAQHLVSQFRAMIKDEKLTLTAYLPVKSEDGYNWIMKTEPSMMELMSVYRYNSYVELVWRFVAGLLENEKCDDQAQVIECFWQSLASEPRDLIGLADFRLQIHCLEETPLWNGSSKDIQLHQNLLKRVGHVFRFLDHSCFDVDSQNIYQQLFMEDVRDVLNKTLKATSKNFKQIALSNYGNDNENQAKHKNTVKNIRRNMMRLLHGSNEVTTVDSSDREYSICLDDEDSVRDIVNRLCELLSESKDTPVAQQKVIKSLDAVLNQAIQERFIGTAYDIREKLIWLISKNKLSDDVLQKIIEILASGLNQFIQMGFEDTSDMNKMTLFQLYIQISKNKHSADVQHKMIEIYPSVLNQAVQMGSESTAHEILSLLLSLVSENTLSTDARQMIIEILTSGLNQVIQMGSEGIAHQILSRLIKSASKNTLSADVLQIIIVILTSGLNQVIQMGFKRTATDILYELIKSISIETLSEDALLKIIEILASSLNRAIQMGFDGPIHYIYSRLITSVSVNALSADVLQKVSKAFSSVPEQAWRLGDYELAIKLVAQLHQLSYNHNLHITIELPEELSQFHNSTDAQFNQLVVLGESKQELTNAVSDFLQLLDTDGISRPVRREILTKLSTYAVTTKREDISKQIVSELFTRLRGLRNPYIFREILKSLKTVATSNNPNVSGEQTVRSLHELLKSTPLVCNQFDVIKVLFKVATHNYELFSILHNALSVGRSTIKDQVKNLLDKLNLMSVFRSYMHMDDTWTSPQLKQLVDLLILMATRQYSLCIINKDSTHPCLVINSPEKTELVYSKAEHELQFKHRLELLTTYFKYLNLPWQPCEFEDKNIVQTDVKDQLEAISKKWHSNALIKMILNNYIIRVDRLESLVAIDIVNLAEEEDDTAFKYSKTIKLDTLAVLNNSLRDFLSSLGLVEEAIVVRERIAIEFNNGAAAKMFEDIFFSQAALKTLPSAHSFFTGNKPVKELKQEVESAKRSFH